MDKTKTKKINAALACLGILFVSLSAIEFFAQIAQALPFITIFLPAFVLAIPIVLAYAFVYSGVAFGTIAGAVAFGGAALLGYATLPFFAAAFIPVALVSAYMITKAKRFRLSFVAASFAALVGIAGVIGIIVLATKMSAVDYMVSYFGEQSSILQDEVVALMYRTIRGSDLLNGAVTQQALDATTSADAIAKMQTIMRDFLNLSLVYIMVIYSMGLGFLTYILPRAYAKREGQSVADIAKFKDYTLPRRFWIVAAVTVIAALIGGSFDLRGFDIVQTTLYSVFVFVFMVQGLSLMAYWLAERKTGKGLRAILMIVAVVFLLDTILPLLGLIENMFGIRKRIAARKAENK